MSEKIVQFNEEIIKGQIKELVRGSVEETLNGLLEAEAEMPLLLDNFIFRGLQTKSAQNS